MGLFDYNFYPDKTKYPWLQRITPFAYLQKARDRIQHGDELTSITGIRFAMTRQGFIGLQGVFGQEPYAGREYDVRRFRSFGFVQLFRWLQANGSFVNGRAIYYDPDNPYAGHDRIYNVSLTLQPTGRFTEDVSYTHEVFHRADDGRLVYDLDIINTRTTYQFTRFVFVRGTVQYDSSRAQVLTDFLALVRDAPRVRAVCRLRIDHRAEVGSSMAPGHVVSVRMKPRGGSVPQSFDLYRF